MKQRGFDIKKSFINNWLLWVYGAIFILVLLIIILFALQAKTYQTQQTLSNTIIETRKDDLKIDELLIPITDNGFATKGLTLDQKNKRIVIFRNATNHPMTLTSPYPNFTAPTISPGSEYTFVFSEFGKWSIFINGTDKSMNILVKKAL